MILSNSKSIFSQLDVERTINELKFVNSPGTDPVQSERFKYGHSKVTGLLSMTFNGIFIENCLPSKFMVYHCCFYYQQQTRHR